MDAWMHGRKDGRMDGWMEGCGPGTEEAPLTKVAHDIMEPTRLHAIRIMGVYAFRYRDAGLNKSDATVDETDATDATIDATDATDATVDATDATDATVDATVGV